MKSNEIWNQNKTKRVSPKRGFARILQGGKKRYRARISEFEDDTPSSMIVRLLIVILLLHLVVIGGIWLRGTLKKGDMDHVATLPAAALASTSSSSSSSSVSAVTDAVITSKNQLVDASLSTEIANKGTNQNGAGQATVEKADQNPPEAGPGRHIVATGDTWESIARDNNCPVKDLKLLNPGAGLVSSSTLVLPMKPAERVVIAKKKKEEEVRIAGETYVIKSGDTLSKIARKNKISVAKLQEYNNITDPRKMKIGQSIRIPSKK